MVISHSEGKDTTLQPIYQAQSAIWNLSKYRQILNNHRAAGYSSTAANSPHQSGKHRDDEFKPPRYFVFIHTIKLTYKIRPSTEQVTYPLSMLSKDCKHP